MASTTPESSPDIKQQRRQCRDEWRRLCETLEGAQGQELIRDCSDKYQYVKTYRVYGRDFRRLGADLRKAASQGQYLFFCERGVPRDVLTPSFVELLLDDWDAAIRAKRRHVAEVFRFKYRDNIESCIVTGEDAAQLNAAQSLHNGDALMQLTGMSQPPITFRDISELRGDVEKLQAEFEALRESVRGEIDALNGRLQELSSRPSVSHYRVSARP